MSRKKSTAAAETAETQGTPEQEVVTDTPPQDTPPAATSEENAQQPKKWGNPYSSIFTSVTCGFEMGEDRRFKQRVFKFAEKPRQEIIDTLKSNGFIYRPADKAWTISATPETRQLSEQLAREFAGNTQEPTR